MNFFDGSACLSLDKLRSILIRLEDTIIFALIERAQFAHNEQIYRPKAFQFHEFEGSFLDFLLLEMEKVHAKVRRYTSPDEYPFHHPLPDPILPCLNYPQTLKPNDINVNKQIMDMYVTQIVPEICKQGDDSNHGSSATKDVECLQALSKRIHYGKFIAEAKFQQDTEKYTKLIKANDRQGILELLTNRAVEEKLLKRLKRKAMIYGQDIDSEDNVVVANGHSNGKIDLDAVVKLYELFVIPLTKEVEVEYLMKRLG